MKRLLSLLLLLTIHGIACAQTIYLRYDASGNRKYRGTDLSVSNGKEATIKDSVLVEQYGISVYPNPTSNVLNVQVSHLPTDKPSTAILYDLNGKVAGRFSPLKTLNEVDMTTTPPGIYILKLEIDKQISSWKIIKQ